MGWKWQVSMVEWSTKEVTAVFERSNKLTKRVVWLAGGAHKEKLRQLLACVEQESGSEWSSTDDFQWT